MEGVLRPCCRNWVELSWKGCQRREYKCRMLEGLSGKLKMWLQILPIPVHVTLQSDVSLLLFSRSSGDVFFSVP